MEQRLVIIVCLLVVVSLVGCSSSKSLERSIGYGKLNLVPPDNWSKEEIKQANIIIEGTDKKIEDKNWGLRKLETGTYLVRVTSEQYFNYGQIIDIKKDQTTKLQPKMAEFNSSKKVISKISSGGLFQAFQSGQWTGPFLAKGINLGLGKPNYFPGDTAITKSEYTRWLEMIGDMNANVIRIYTIHPPGFYEALYEYNQDNSDPIYLLHGAWIEEETLNQNYNLFNSRVTTDFDQEIENIIDIVHGQAIIEPKTGHAGGIYRKDISDYVLGYILGIEWDPYLVKDVNQTVKSDFKGNYFTTNQAEPFEIWLAERMEKAIAYEEKSHNKQRSISFTNWVTTDAIPTANKQAEPESSQRLVSINADNIQPTAEFKAGYFASYHAYPYYPDYINQAYSSDNYARYLAELKDVHQLPILIAEFGVPASRGKAHESAQPGRDQGFLSEQEQGTAIKGMFNDINSQGLMGGLIFSWQDEFFKRTWNTMKYDNSHRRPYWPDVQTNEQFFGLLSFDIQARQGIYVDGSESGWDLIDPFYQVEGSNLFNKVYVANDAASLYLRLHYQEAVDFSTSKTYILLNINDNLGQTEALGQQLAGGVDFVVKLAGQDQSRVLVAEDYDLFAHQYGLQVTDENYPFTISGFNPVRLVLNRGENELPFDYYETGKLMFGNGNPQASNYNSLTDVAVEGKVLELRLPWGLLNVKDPSCREVMGNFKQQGFDSSVITEGVSIKLVGQTGETVTSVLPKQAAEVKTYQWKTWNRVRYEERKKESYYLVKELFD